MRLDQMFLLAIGSLAPVMVMRNLRLLRNPRALRHHVESSFRFKRLRTQLGVDGTVEMARRRLLPFSTALWAILAVLTLASVITKF